MFTQPKAQKSLKVEVYWKRLLYGDFLKRAESMLRLERIEPIIHS